EALHDIVASLQTSPSGLQPIGFRQTPTANGGVMSHVTGLPDPPGSPSAPQQSVSFVHKSPTTWQPLAGWQTRTPVGPYGAQRRLQQPPPHEGIPASFVTTPPSAPAPAQSMPSTSVQFAAPAGGWAHVPSVAPFGMVQTPAQQSVGCAQTSPIC